MFDLSQKVVIVTGASRGIGRGIAEVLAGRGAHVVAAARRDNAAATVELKAQTENVFLSAAHLHEMVRRQPPSGGRTEPDDISLPPASPTLRSPQARAKPKPQPVGAA